MSHRHATAVVAIILSLAGLTLTTAACRRQTTTPMPTKVATPAGLLEHSKEFERRIYEVTDGVHVAVGYAMANSILIEGEDGVIIVDTTESLQSGREVREAFRTLTDKPVVAVIYTHNHGDHVFGGEAFVDDPANPPDVYAHDTTLYYINRLVNVVRPAITWRSMQMFGNYLPRHLVPNCGIGAQLKLGHGGGTSSLLPPTHTFSDQLELDIAGVRLRLVHAPGETNDQIFVWLPDKKVLLPGDNFYRAFPNLYTIRGTSYRDVMDWVGSLDLMRRLRPEHLVPSHSRPLSGGDHIYAQLTDYRDAIAYVHDQTVRGINRGLTPDELVSFVRLPAHLAENPWLQEYYGTVEWSVRAIFNGYLGWFDGNTATLSPMPPRQRAQRMAALASGSQGLKESAHQALDDGDLRWAAELTDHLLRLDPDDSDARELKAAALEGLSAGQTSPNGRNFYLTQAGLLRGQITPDKATDFNATADLVYSLPLAGIMASMAVGLDAAKAADVDQVVAFVFPDTGEKFMLHVRRGVMEVQPYFFTAAEVTVTVDSKTWKDILLQRRNPLAAFAAGDIQVEGGTLDLVRFLALFDRA
ncbi:MAG: alkyl sulfatase dimerization domain-containing protein [Deltaproteobacteria bacterium]